MFQPNQSGTRAAVVPLVFAAVIVLSACGESTKAPGSEADAVEAPSSNANTDDLETRPDQESAVRVAYTVSQLCEGDWKLSPTVELFANILDWVEIYEAPADVVGEIRPAALGPIVAEMAVGRIGQRAKTADRREYELTELWTPEAIAAVQDTETRVFIGIGRPPWAPEAPPIMLMVLAADADDFAVVGPCRSSSTDFLMEVLGEDAHEQVIAFLKMDPLDVRDTLRGYSEPETPPSPTIPQLAPGLSDVEGVDLDALKEFVVRVEVSDPPGDEILLCLATDAYVGICAGMTAFQSIEGTDGSYVDLGILAEPNEAVRMIWLPDDAFPDRVNEIAAIDFDDDLRARLHLSGDVDGFTVEPLPVGDLIDTLETAPTAPRSRLTVDPR